mmetsp:Transcript_13228/g.26989  ORF Transcript_13228/g.26989 Transcript_13228/m.26989 type:complete len:475 (+) Transcript_13228:419-1843(+)
MSTYSPLSDSLSSPPSPPQTTGVIPKATFFSCTANLANTILGSGLLGLPGAFAGSGSLTGTILLIIASLGSANGLRLLSLCARKVGYKTPTSFYSVANAAAPSTTNAIDIAVAVKCFGVATSYLIIVADTMVDSMEYFVGDSSWLVERWLWVVVGACCVTSLSFFKTLDALKFTSAIAILFVFALTVVIIIYSTGEIDPCGDILPDECKGTTELTKPFGSTLKKLSTFVFAFTCHQNIFSVCNEIRDRRQAAVEKVIAASISTGLVLYLVVAWSGYNTFGSNVESDILNNYPLNALVTTMRIFVALLVIFSYPLQLDPSRRCITTLVNKVRLGKGEEIGEGGIEIEVDEDGTNIEKESLNGLNSSDFSSTGEKIKGNKGKSEGVDDLIFLVITVTFLGCSFLLAMAVDDLGIMLALVGATGSTAVSYILPGIIYLKLFEDDSWTATRIAAGIQLVCGFVIMPVALYYTTGGGGE